MCPVGYVMNIKQTVVSPTGQAQLLQVFCSTKEDGAYRDPSDCHKYIECTRGHGHQSSCPLNFVFDEMTLACQQPYHTSDCSP